jgi:hypothetical protein
MEDSITFKPILWRLILWKFIPFCIGVIIVELIFKAIDPYNSSLFAFGLDMAFAALIGTTISVLIFRKKFEIAVRNGNISGPSTGWFLPRETIVISNLDFSYRDKQSFSEKISFFRTIHSLSGQTIMVADLIYEKPLTNELYSILEQGHLQSNNKK